MMIIMQTYSHFNSANANYKSDDTNYTNTHKQRDQIIKIIKIMPEINILYEFLSTFLSNAQNSS